ncbi:hypothetical protein H6F61_03550 [Cyanobacteria bacterium FACHB-472]|nr:hypothetical protein [Cyanobacteria bacterium FACHB-472]
MLSQIVRPMVRTQIRSLANSLATRSTLISTIAQWLGFLGVQAQVTHLEADSDQKISICLTVGKPEGCDSHDWQQIVHNINQEANDVPVEYVQPQLTPQQQSKLQRLFAYLIQVAEPEVRVGWEIRSHQLQGLGLDEQMLLGIRSALKVPQSLDRLMAGIDPDLAAIALPKAVSIAWLDGQVNSSEDDALTALLEVMKQPAKV